MVDSPYTNGGNESAKERKSEDDAKVPEEVFLLELVARVEDDRR
jgi:hypothetical protein